MKPRRISNEELADLPSTWENPTVDTRHYYQCVMVAYEVDQDTYQKLKELGSLVQTYNGRFYAA